MSQENVELWRASIEDLLGTDVSDWEGWVDRAADLWDPEIEWDLSALVATAPDMNPIYRGIDAVRGFWREWFAAWQALDFEYELIDAGDRVVCLLEQQMRGRSTGIEVPIGGQDGKYAQVATFRDGLMTHWKLYPTQAEALEAVGLSE
jgi:SnoaL-like protein